MRTPDEIKWALKVCSELCSSASVCKFCPYDDECRRMTEEENIVPGSAMMRDAIEYIQRLEAEIPHWISTKERLPELDRHDHSQSVCSLLLKTNGDIDIGCRINARGLWSTLCGVTRNEYVAYWMPLPERPTLMADNPKPSANALIREKLEAQRQHRLAVVDKLITGGAPKAAIEVARKKVLETERRLACIDAGVDLAGFCHLDGDADSDGI